MNKERTSVEKHEAMPLHSNADAPANKLMLNGQRWIQVLNKALSRKTGESRWNPPTEEPIPTEAHPMRVLFLCTHNSARSQMAEGLLRSHGGDAYQVFSAGTHTTSVHPLAIRAMQEIGIDINTHRAKWLEEFITEPPMDLVVTVCDNTAEACPSFPNARWQIHWHFADPAQVMGSAEEQLAAFRYIRDLMAAKIKSLPAQNS